MSRRPPNTQWKGFGATVLTLWLIANAWNLPADALQQQPEGIRHIDTKNDAASSSTDSRALAPFHAAPVGRFINSDTVRAHSAKPGTSNGLSSGLPVRSLQDWRVEDIVLLATVDGMIHATDRNTGQELWALEADKEMVETTYNPRNRSLLNGSSDAFKADFIWIVEPSQDGQLYGYTPGSPLGMQRLGFSVKQLVEQSPYYVDEPPVVYTGEKRNTLYTVDIASGKILKSFSASQSSVYPDQDTCRQVGELDALDDDKCGATGTLTLTRTEYIVGVSSSITGEQISTIRYSEWGPNNRDKDLFNQYATTKGDRYIHSRHNGEIIAIDNQVLDTSDPNIRRTPKYRHKFGSPVARVFDIARPLLSTTLDTPLVILPQPLNPTFDEEDKTNIFVNCTNNGSWYAMSESLYPLVTRGANTAQCAKQDWSFKLPHGEDSFAAHLKEVLVGVHPLAIEEVLPQVPRIGGSIGLPTIGEGDEENRSAPIGHVPALPGTPFFQEPLQGSYRLTTIFIMFLVALTTTFWYKKAPSLKALAFSARDGDVLLTPRPGVSRTASIADVPVVAVDGQAKELPNNTDALPNGVRFTEPEKAESEINDEPAQAIVEDKPKAKKKAHRGARGGKKEAKRRQTASGEDEVNEALEEGKKEVSIKPDIIYQSANGANGDGPAGLMNLKISSEVILGQGSGGTIVFAGVFEGRDVAIKRMLGQYSQLASQEVSLLEQNEDHPNVIKYFCWRQDDHFLYIALERCQASLWDLFRDGRPDEVSEQHRALVQAINQHPDQVLRQLAEGLKHLHNFRIVHRDIKPQNMLIAFPKKQSTVTFPRLVISDFGLCKTLPPNTSTLIGATISAGTTGWKAPELIFQPRDLVNGSTHSTGRDSTKSNGESTGAQGVKRAVDIFSLGCVFFYVFTGGKHPFDDDEGWMGIRERNIKANRCNLSELEKYQSYDIKNLIEWMLSPRPEDRPTAAEVLAHPFFWSAEDKLEFLSLASDRFDIEARDGTSSALQALELRAIDIIGAGPSKVTYAGSGINSVHQRSSSSHSNSTHPPDKYEWNMVMPGEPNFLAALDRKFIDTLGKQRKYQGHKLVDLLRALRNKHHHWDDMPEDVKAKVGSVPDGYYNYWDTRFPALLVGVWSVVKEVGMSEDGRFDRWYKRRIG